MPEISGTQITVTKKATTIKLEQQPPLENNNLQEEFTKAPGLLITEQHNPGQFNFSYRGLGNPQESEFILVLQDGLPLMSDWIGFPTLYYLPLPQSVSEIQLIRGGSSLIYGPEPAPAVNYVMKHPAPGSPWDFYTEQIGGAYGLYSTYNVVQEAVGPVEFRLDEGYVRTDGQRDNSQYDLWQSNLYVGYRPDETQLTALDFHLSRFDGGDPGRLTFQQFWGDPSISTTPYNHNWVDRYTTVLRHEHDLGDGWLLQVKGWFTHQDIDSRTAANIDPITGAFPTSTTLGYEAFNNGGVDARVRKRWGEETMFKGSALTFGGLIYHGDAPFQRYRSMDLDAPRGETTSDVTLDQDRTADYQAFFIENLFRLGKFHLVGSFRLDHENVEVDSQVAPFVMGAPVNRSADRTIPLWGVGVGNDFGDRNETYFSASSGWRPVRFFDIASTSRAVPAGQAPDPFESLDLELGVHGTPLQGFWYDVGAFWMEFDNRTESRNISNTEVIIVNTGSTRHRGFEGEVSYDFLARYQHPPVATPLPEPGKDVVDKNVKNVAVPGVSAEEFRPWRLIFFSNVQFLDAEFTDSMIPDQVGKTPAFAPDLLWKGGITFGKERCFNVTLSAVYVTEQFWSDANTPAITPTGVTPAKLDDYKVLNLSGEWYFTKHARLIAGISNLTDEKYYSRVFFNGSIEPAPRISGYGGVSVEF